MRQITYWAVIALLWSAPGCGDSGQGAGSDGTANQHEKSHAPSAIPAAELNPADTAWHMIGQGALLIDVRSAEEYAEGHLPGAINISHTLVDELAAAIGAQPDRPVVLYCRSGRRSGAALKALSARGYTDLHNGGGYQDLINATR